MGLTRDELRAGLVRLALVIGLTVGLIVAGGIVLWLSAGGALNDALALAFSLAGAVLVAGGAAAGLSATRIAMDRSHGQRRPHLTSPADRQQRELLALGLIGSGVVSFVIALALG